MDQENRTYKAYACFNVHKGKIYACWVDEYFVSSGSKETDFNGDVKACMEYWTELHKKKNCRCFVRIFET